MVSKARFAILGPLMVTRDGTPVPLERKGLRRRLLAALLVSAPYPVSEDKLADFLWGGEPERWREQRLQPAISRLRGTLRATGERPRIVHQGAAYVIELDRDELDAFVFDDLRKQAFESLRRGDPGDAVNISDRALALWRGPALSDFADEPFAVERARPLDGSRLVARQVRIEALLALGGQDAEVVPEAEALLDIEPDNDAVWASLMLALHRCRRTGKAQAVYRNYVEHVGTNGREPAADLVALHAAIAAADPALEWQPPAGHRVGGRSDASAAPRTFLFTALEVDGGRDAKPDPAALEIHDAVVREAIGAHDGRVFGEAGHGAHVVFERPVDAVLAARDAAVELRRAAADRRTLRVRMAVHTGEATVNGASFTGPAVTRLGRVRDAGHPGQVVISSATRELVADDLPDGLLVVGIGACQFAGASRPERVFQLVDPELPSEFPPLRGGRRLTGELPRYTTGFVGREREVTDIAGRLSRPGLVTITGGGGIGKTRLAVEVAERRTPTIAEGVCYCDVSRVDDAATLVERLAVARGLTVATGIDPRRELIRSFEATELLLVLDGCERLKEPVRQLVADIIRSGADVRVLVTSLGRLGVTVEQVVKLGPLSVRGPTDREPEAAPAVLLLRERAAQSGARLAPTDPQLVDLAERLDGLPLAIELVAPMLGQFSPATVIERLDRCLATASGSSDAPSRHRTLRATFDWSFDLVSAPAGRLFGALSLFRDPWSLETAEAVAPAVEVEPDDVMTLTTELIDQSLVRVDMPPDGTARYTMLDTIRGYGHEHLRSSGRYDDVADLHARHFLDLAERAVPHRRGPDEPAWVGELHAEFDDLRAAYRRFVDTGRPAEALRLTVALTHDLLMRERLEIGRWAVELAGLPSLADDQRRVEVLGLAATAAMLEARLDDAIDLAREAVDAEAATGAPRSWTARNVLAMMTAVGMIGGGGWTDHLRDMVEIGARADDPFPEALTLWDRAFVAKWSGECERGEEPASELVALGNRLDNHSIRSMGLLALGRVAAERADVERARDLLQQAWGAAETARNTLVLGQTRRELADLDTRSDDRAAALAALRSIIEGFAVSGNVAEQLQTALTIVKKLVALGVLVPAAVALEVMDRTLLGDTPGYDQMRARVVEGLSDAERAEVHRTVGRMPQSELVPYLVRIVGDLAAAEQADGDEAEGGEDAGGEGGAGTGESE